MKMNCIHENLRRLRLEKGISQRELAEATGIDRNVITRIETNVRNAHDIEVKKFCDYFNVSYQELMN